jgi:hypothetical protein
LGILAVQSWLGTDLCSDTCHIVKEIPPADKKNTNYPSRRDD